MTTPLVRTLIVGHGTHLPQLVMHDNVVLVHVQDNREVKFDTKHIVKHPMLAW